MSNANGDTIGDHNPSFNNENGWPVILRGTSLAWLNLGTDGESRRVFFVQRARAMIGVLLRGVRAGGRVFTGAFGNDATMERIEREKYGPRTVTYTGLPGA